MKILVTGGAGFIGSNFIFYLIKSHPDYEIVCYDLLTYAGNIHTIENEIRTKRITFEKGDISDREAVYHMFEKYRFDTVVNFAAESHVDRSIKNPGVFIQTNVLGTQVLLDAALKYDVKRFHQVSTDEVYGDLPLHRKDLLFTEDTPIHTSSPYSASKASADLLTLAYYRTYGLPVTISRCSNNYGPYHFPEKLIPLVISRALNNQAIPVYGKGENIRDWLYVEDHCEAIDMILLNGVPGEVYNIGGNTEKTNLEVVQTILRILGKSDSLIKFVSDRPGHDLRYAIDASKIRNLLNWAPSTSFDQGISKTIDWYIQNEVWWSKILEGEYKTYFEQMYTKK